MDCPNAPLSPLRGTDPAFRPAVLSRDEQAYHDNRPLDLSSDYKSSGQAEASQDSLDKSGPLFPEACSVPMLLRDNVLYYGSMEPTATLSLGLRKG
jgi:hypothetical protein